MRICLKRLGTPPAMTRELGRSGPDLSTSSLCIQLQSQNYSGTEVAIHYRPSREDDLLAPRCPPAIRPRSSRITGSLEEPDGKRRAAPNNNSNEHASEPSRKPLKIIPLRIIDILDFIYRESTDQEERRTGGVSRVLLIGLDRWRRWLIYARWEISIASCVSS